MIANISPSSACFEDTHNTLKYANRAKNIKTTVQRNVHNVEYHISKYTQIIAQLRGEITELKTQIKTGGVPGGMLIPNQQELEKSKEELTTHFIDEVKVKKRIHELEQKMESVAMILSTKRGEAAAVAKEKGKDNMQLKLINEEIDEANTQMRELKT
jgi:kinesin family member 18/19